MSRESDFRDGIIRDNNKVKDELRLIFSKTVADALYKDLDNTAQLLTNVISGSYRVNVVNQSTSTVNPTGIESSEGRLSVEISNVYDEMDTLFIPTRKQEFSVTYEFDKQYFQFRGAVYKGFYDDGLTFVEDEYVGFELDSPINAEHLMGYRQALNALSYSIASDFPKSVTVMMPNSVGDKTIDEIITKINTILNGVRLMSEHKDGIVDYDSKMERVVNVLNNFEQELLDVTNGIPRDLDTFETALRMLEQQSGMSV